MPLLQLVFFSIASSAATWFQRHVLQMTDHFLQPNKEHSVSEKGRQKIGPASNLKKTMTPTTTNATTTTTTTKTSKYSNTKDSPYLSAHNKGTMVDLWPCRMQFCLNLYKFPTDNNHFFLPRRSSPTEPRPPHYRGFMTTLRHTTLGRTPLDEWSARRRGLHLTTQNTHNRQTFLSRRDSNPQSSKRAAVDPRLRPRGLSDQ